jgi:hypothetical protein
VKITDSQLRLSASDVANFLACQHLTRLDLLQARGELAPPHRFDIGFQDLIKLGAAHEKDVLERFRAGGRQVVEIGEGPDADAAEATTEAIRDGAELVYQGVLAQAGASGQPVLFGRPDFLVRADLLPAPDGEPRPDGIHYEVIDAKLARSAKARAVMQKTQVRTDGLGSEQGAALGNRTPDLRITRVFRCVPHGHKACASFMSAGCCWWRSLAVDGSLGTSRGHPSVMHRPGPRRHGAVVRPSA